MNTTIGLPAPTGWFRCWGTGLLLAAGLTAVAAEENRPDDIIELPKLVVTDSPELPPPESWRYATIPGMEILSNAPDRATERLLEDFQLFRQALGIVWPTPNKATIPMRLILCNRRPQFESFLPADRRPGSTPVSVYLKGRTRSTIVIDTGARMIAMSDVGFEQRSGVVHSTVLIEQNKQLYREYLHYLLSQSEPRLPAWFEEGLTQVILSMQLEPDQIEFGKLREQYVETLAMSYTFFDTTPEPESDSMADEPVEDKEFNAALIHRALMPLEKLLSVPPEAPETLNPLGNNLWAKQAYAFVHFGLFAEKRRWSAQFLEFVRRSTRGPVTEEMFRQCFKMSSKDLLAELRGYIRTTNYESQVYRAKDRSAFLTAAPLNLREATPAEIGRIKGQAQGMAGHAAAARVELTAPYIRGDRDPGLLAALGLIELAGGKEDRARKFLAAAVARQTTDPEAYIELARLQYADALAGAKEGSGPFTAEQVAAITKLLLAARTLPPPVPATYDLLADTLAHSPARPSLADVQPLGEGVMLFPKRMRLVYLAASLCADGGLLEAAHSLVDHGLRFAPDAETKARFQQLKVSLPPFTPPPEPAVTPAAKSR